MDENRAKPRRSYRQLERTLIAAVLSDLAAFLVMMLVSHLGILWLKVTLGILIMAFSAAGCCFLVLIDEYKRSRSLWVTIAFGSLLLCTLVSLITGSPA